MMEITHAPTDVGDFWISCNILKPYVISAEFMSFFFNVLLYSLFVRPS